MTNSAVSQQLIESYSTAVYRVFNEEISFDMRVGQFSPELAQIFEKRNAQTGCNITAFNPLSETTDAERNAAANACLLDDLRLLNCEILATSGFDDLSDWTPEAGFLAFGISEVDMRRLGKKYRQNAVLWIDENSIPQLMLLR